MGEIFYAEGLRFSCRCCSACCRGAPGYVFLSKPDLARLLARLTLDFPSFFSKYCLLVDTGMGVALSLAEKRASGGSGLDCVFWEAGGCSVYDDRPVQCSTYPFWSSILGDRDSWEGERRDCPGIDSGELRDKRYIEVKLYERRDEGTILLDYGLDPETVDADTILGR